MTPILTLLNQKGGVGKTSTCHHLAGALAKLGRRVLLIDNDPQASLSQGLFGSEAVERLDPAGTVARAYHDRPMLLELARPSGVEGISIVVGSPEIAEVNLANPSDAEPGLVVALRELLHDELDGYDVVLIDCPPNLQLLSLAALVASTHLLVPVLPEDYGAQGIWPVTLFASTARAWNPGLQVLGYVVSQHDRRLSLHAMYEARLRERYGEEILASVVPKAVAYPEAIAHQLPVSHYDPRSRAAEAMKAVALEVVDRIAAGARKAESEVAS